MFKLYTALYSHGWWRRYIPVVLLVCIQCALFQQQVNSWTMVFGADYEVSVSDCVINFFWGLAPYQSGSEDVFSIPPVWSLYLLYFIALLAFMVDRLDKRFTMQIILRKQSRHWWCKFQSYVICMETFMYVGATVIGFLVYMIVRRLSLFAPTDFIQKEFIGVCIDNYDNTNGILVRVIVALIFVLLLFAFLQTLVAHALNLITGVIVSIVLLVLSVFWMNPILPGNYLMLIRYKEQIENGMSLELGIVISSLVIVISVFADQMINKKKDLF